MFIKLTEYSEGMSILLPISNIMGVKQNEIGNSSVVYVKEKFNGEDYTLVRESVDEIKELINDLSKNS